MLDAERRGEVRIGDMRGGALPEAVGVAEHKVARGRGNSPITGRHLRVELPGAPAGIAGEDEKRHMAVTKERDDEFLAHGKKHPRHDVTLGHGRDRMKREQWPLEWPAVHEHEVGGARPIRFLVPDRIEALGARAIDRRKGVVVSPADGRILNFGRIEQGTLVQAKGRHYRVAELLGDAALGVHFEGGAFATV